MHLNSSGIEGFKPRENDYQVRYTIPCPNLPHCNWIERSPADSEVITSSKKVRPLSN